MKVFGLNYNKQVKVGEHLITLPDPPKKKEDIFFYKESYENAYWKRQTDYPDIWFYFVPYKTIIDSEATLYNEDRTELAYLSKDDTKIMRGLYERELDRRINGVFFKNGDDLEYITGSNYFTIQWCRFFGNPDNGGYGNYTKFQRDIFYLLDHMWHPNILGLYISKAKKTGITQIIDGGYFVDLATRKEEWMLGMMSVNINKANDNNMKLFLYAFDSLPLALKPNVGFRATKAGNLEFSESTKIKSGKQANNVLNTRVFTVPTSEHSFDSHFMNVQHSDEFPKYFADSNQHPKEIFRNNKAGVKFQNVFRGRYILSSYPPEKDDEGSKEGEEVYLKSKLSTMDEDGKTESELICYHIPAHKSYFACIDKYGDCDEVKALKIILRNRERVKKDKKAYLAEVRQNPLDEKEAFGTGGATSVFDTVYLNDLKYDLNEEIINSPFPISRPTKLVWENALWEIGKKDKRPPGVFCPVIRVPLTEREVLDGVKSNINEFRDIPYEDKNLPLRLGRDEIGNILAPKKFKYFGGTDPINYADDEAVEEPSMQSNFTMNIHDERLNTIHKEIVSKIIISEYNGRPELAEEAYQDIVKEIIYYGKLVLVEGNSPTFFTRLMNEGLGNYMIVKHKDSYLCRWNISMEKTEYKSVKRTRNGTQDEIMESLIEVIKHYTYRSEDDTRNQYAKTIKSLGLLEQLCKFSPTETKKYDRVMGFGYCLLAYETYRAELAQVKDDVYNEVAIKALFGATERA